MITRWGAGGRGRSALAAMCIAGLLPVTAATAAATAAATVTARPASATSTPVIARFDGMAGTTVDSVVAGMSTAPVTRVVTETVGVTNPPNGIPPATQTWTPAAADTQVGTDGTRLVQAVNSRLRVSDMAGGSPVTLELATVFGAPSDAFVYNPSLIRDRATGRWMIAAAVVRFTNEGTAEGAVQLAVSQTTNPAAGYAVTFVKRYDEDGQGVSYLAPKVASTDDKVVVTYGVAACSAPPCAASYQGTGMTVFAKLPLLSGGTPLARVYPADSTRPDAIPAQSLSTGTAAYVSSLTGSGLVQLDVIDGTPLLSDTRVSHVVSVAPRLAPAPSGGGRLPSGGYRVHSPVYRDGSWWGASVEGCSTPDATGDRDCVRVWQLGVSPTGTPTIVQDFDIAQPAVDLFLPALAVDAEHNLSVVMSRATFPGQAGILVVGQASGSPANTISAPLYERIGPSFDDSGWGRYAGAAVAPDSVGVWLSAQYSANTVWGTDLIGLRPAKLGITAVPSRVQSTPGGSVSASIDVTSLHGFSGAAALSVSGVPTGTTATISPSSVTLAAGGSATATLTVNSAVSQSTDFVVTVTACAAGECARADVWVALQQFTVEVSSAGVPRIEPGTSALSFVTVRSVHGWAGTVSLSVATGRPTASATISPPTVTVPAGGSASATVTSSVGLAETAFDFFETVTGCSGYCRTDQVHVYVKQPMLYPQPFTLDVPGGGTAAGEILVVSQNDWAGTANLVLSGVPAGVTASLSPTSLPVAANEVESSLLTVTLPAGWTSPFTVTVQACPSYCRTTHMGVNPV